MRIKDNGTMLGEDSWLQLTVCSYNGDCCHPRQMKNINDSSKVVYATFVDGTVQYSIPNNDDQFALQILIRRADCICTEERGYSFAKSPFKYLVGY